MKHARIAVFTFPVLLLAWAAVLPAQEKKVEAPKPGPEVRRLGYFVGTWRSEGEIKQNPFTPAGKFSSTDECEWFPGGFHVVCRSRGTGPAGPMRGLGILAWSPEEKAYTWSGIDNTGLTVSAKGHVDGNSWTYRSEDMLGGKTHHGRYTLIISNSYTYSFKYETSEDGKNWMEVMAGKATRAEPADKK